ncbi:MAG: sugar phosphate isomerase/epimerase [Chloroflexales bacterium]|nr:sugar phosphate isomerase/epimerase [Chloroflexales bacterium]
MLVGLSALSFSFRCGLVGRGTSRAVASPLGIDAIIALAVRAGLQSVALPIALLPDQAPARLAALRDRLAMCGLTPVVDTDVIDLASLEAAIPVAAALGTRILRVLASPVLEGARAAFTADWEAYLAGVIARLRAARPLAEQYGITLALENHQDLTTDDLLHVVAEVGGIGVTFDPVNALIVAEDPFTAVHRLAPHICNVHLADYIAYPSHEGWRLVRCALGEGDLNLRRLLVLLAALAPAAPCQIELVSHSARHVRLLTDAWWRGYPARDIRDVLPVLREFAAPSRSRDDDWRTPWERGAPEEQIALYEDQQYASSLTYLRSIGVLTRP